MIRRLAAAAVLTLALAGCGTTVPGSPVPELPEAPTPHIVATGAALERPVRVDIPRLGVSDDVVPVGIDRDRHMEIPPVDQVGVYEHAPMPGEQGPAILAGHVDYAGQPGAFKRLHELQPGDDIIVTGEDGQTLTFRVYRMTSFPKSTFDYSIYADTSAPELRAVTCGGDVVNHSYTDNVVAWARLRVGA